MVFILFSIFPSFSFLGLYAEYFISNIFMSKTDKEFNNIVEQEEKKQELINVAIIGNKAYWVQENIFYEADFENDEVKKETRKPVDVFEMSLYDIDKMLFILDNLKEG